MNLQPISRYKTVFFLPSDRLHFYLVSGALGSAIGLPNSGLESVLRGSSGAQSGAGSDGQPATTGSSSPWEMGARTPDEGRYLA